jgi:hypothetical protein
MNVVNIHECVLEREPEQVGALIDSLASRDDRLWPVLAWPRMTFDKPLGLNARGGHGPIRYVVEEYSPGNSVKFRFTGPNGFDGYHGFSIQPRSERDIVLRHSLIMHARGLAMLSWPWVFRPLHDALIEDALSTARCALGLPTAMKPWSIWVKLLRWLVSGGRARAQTIGGCDMRRDA